MIKFGAITIDVSHPLAFAKTLSEGEPEKSLTQMRWAFFNEVHLRCMKNEAGLRPMKRGFGI